MQQQIWMALNSDPRLKVLAFFVQSDIDLLKQYAGSHGITFPIDYDQQDNYFNLFQVGAVYSNIPPTWIIVDKKGIIQYRADTAYGKAAEMKAKIVELLAR